MKRIMSECLVAFTTAILLAVVACTKPEITAVETAVQLACIPVVSLETSAAAPAICVAVDDWTMAIGSYVIAHAGVTPPVQIASDGTAGVGPDLYALLAKAPKTKALTATTMMRCPKVPAGKVVP